ncbi:MAG: DUF2148 domain-containing protein [Oscillospiraceae bacterium]|jgi:uncharacterized ferredoxin-like protein|nr:DUF2148 domain-containing protein [Oscillospiraceae bacterium]
MLINSKTAEYDAVIQAANTICAAIRTAPKGCGFDFLDSAILTDEDKDKISAEMRKIGESHGERGAFFARDAGNVDNSQAVVLVGATYDTRKLSKMCQLCGFESCSACSEAGAACVFAGVDLGIALGSAVSKLAELGIDNRIMYTIGKAAAALGYLGEYKMIMGIPLSVSCKSPFFDR